MIYRLYYTHCHTAHTAGATSDSPLRLRECVRAQAPPSSEMACHIGRGHAHTIQLVDVGMSHVDVCMHAPVAAIMAWLSPRMMTTIGGACPCVRNCIRRHSIRTDIMEPSECAPIVCVYIYTRTYKKLFMCSHCWSIHRTRTSARRRRRRANKQNRRRTGRAEHKHEWAQYGAAIVMAPGIRGSRRGQTPHLFRYFIQNKCVGARKAAQSGQAERTSAREHTRPRQPYGLGGGKSAVALHGQREIL